MAGKGRSGRGGVCRRGHAEPCGRAVLDQENLPARWLSRAVLSCRSQRPSHHCAHHQRLVDRSSSRPRHPPASAGLHDLRPGRRRCCGGSRMAPISRALARDAGVSQATGYRYHPRGLGGDRPTISRCHRRPGQAPPGRRAVRLPGRDPGPHWSSHRAAPGQEPLMALR